MCSEHDITHKLCDDIMLTTHHITLLTLSASEHELSHKVSDKIEQRVDGRKSCACTNIQAQLNSCC